MRIFVTGGSGFIGTALIRMLCAEGHQVLALARSSRSVATVREAGAVAVSGDLESTGAWTSHLIGCDAVVHSAALMTFDDRLDHMARVNINGTRRILDAARAAGVHRFIAVGAGAVLSAGRPVHRADEQTPLPRRSLGAYAQTKRRAEELVIEADAPNFQAMVVSPPAVWGAGDPFLLPQLARAVRRRRLIWIDHGRYPFSFCHVRNVCHGIVCALKLGRGGQRYLIADAPPTPTFRQAISELLATQGLPAPRRSLPRWLILALALGVECLWWLLRRRDPPPLSRAAVALIAGEFTIDDTKARREIGYHSPVTREQGLAELQAAAQPHS